jgi:hypothetical protein
VFLVYVIMSFALCMRSRVSGHALPSRLSELLSVTDYHSQCYIAGNLALMYHMCRHPASIEVVRTDGTDGLHFSKYTARHVECVAR